MRFLCLFIQNVNILLPLTISNKYKVSAHILPTILISPYCSHLGWEIKLKIK